MNNVQFHINDCCQIFDSYNKNQNIKLSSSKHDSSQLNLIINSLKEISNNLDPSNLNTIPTLYEAGRKICELDSYCRDDIKDSDSNAQQITAATCHSKASNLLLLIDKTMIDNFLKLNSNEQEICLADPAQANAIKQALHNPELNITVRNPENGDYLFHELCRNKSFAINQLAFECLMGGFNINTQKQNGATALHIAVNEDNFQLLKLLLDYGANPELKTSPENANISPLDLAVQKGTFSCALLLSLAQPNQKIKDVPTPIYFINQIQNLAKNENAIPMLIELINKYSKTHDIKEFTEELWIGCKSAIIGSKCSPDDSLKSDQNLISIINWMLINTPKLTPIPYEQMYCIQEVAGKVCSRKLSEPQDFQFIKSLAAQELLSNVVYLTINPETSVLNILRESLLLPNDLHNNLSTYMNDDELKAHRKIHSIFHQLFTASKLDSLDLINEFDENYKKYDKGKFPIIEDLKQKIDILTNDLRELFNKFSELIKNLKIGSITVNNLDVIDKNLFKQYAAHQKEWEIVAKLTIMGHYQFNNITAKINRHDLSQSSDDVELMGWHVNKTIFHFMMDKLMFQKSENYIASYSTNMAYSMINALKSMAKNEKLNASLTEKSFTNTENFNKLSELLSEFIIFCELSPELAAQKILERIRNMKPGESVLIPTGSKEHATSLLVEKNGSGTFKLTQYNTGQGVLTWHARWENSTRYQTHYIIDNIPMESIVNKDAWKEIFTNKSEAKDMNPTYMNIRDKLGKGGTVLPPSKHQEDYEAKQASGTCAMQNLMAFLRHQCMQMAEGSPAEKEAVYKMIKTNLFIAYHNDNLNEVDEVIQDNLPSVLRKLKAEIKLVEIAQGEKQFNEAMDQMKSLFSQMSKQDIFQQLTERNFDTTMARYAILRTASTILCEIWLENPNQPPPSNLSQLEVFDLGFAKFEHHKAILQNIETSLNKIAQEQNPAALSFELYRILGATPYEDMAIEKIIKYFGDEIPGPEGKVPLGMQELLKNLSKFKDHTNYLVQKILTKLENNNKFELASWAKNYWKEVTTSPPVEVKNFD